MVDVLDNVRRKRSVFSLDDICRLVIQSGGKSVVNNIPPTVLDKLCSIAHGNGFLYQQTHTILASCSAETLVAEETQGKSGLLAYPSPDEAWQTSHLVSL
jgi:hypothetical protein